MIRKIAELLKKFWFVIVGASILTAASIGLPLGLPSKDAAIRSNFRIPSREFYLARSSSTYTGSYRFTCSPVVNVLNYEFKGAYYSDLIQSPMQHETEVNFEIYGTQTNPKEVLENLVYTISPNTICVFEKNRGHESN